MLDNKNKIASNAHLFLTERTRFSQTISDCKFFHLSILKFTTEILCEKPVLFLEKINV